MDLAGLAALIARTGANEEEAADQLQQKLQLPERGLKLTRGLIAKFIRSYKNKPPQLSAEEWLRGEFAKYPKLWESEEALARAAAEVVGNVDLYEDAKQDLERHLDRGLSRDNWLAKKVEQGAVAHGVGNVGAYAAEIESAIANANAANVNALYRGDGQLNQQLNLDGFIAEQHHANTFNIDATAKGIPHRADVLVPGPGETYGKNSVDLVIRDGDDRIVRRYQAKYGADSDATKALFGKGDYRGQRKLVPKGQAADVPGSSDCIDFGGASSQPLSKAEAKGLQRDAQQHAEARQHDWNSTNKFSIVKSIAGHAGLAAAVSVAYNGGRALVRRAWNTLTGKENATVEEDLQQFVSSSLKSAAGSGLTVAASGATVVAAKKGLLGKALAGTPAGRIANAVCLGVENVRILAKLGRGEITGKEALDQAGKSSCALVGGLAAATKGAAVGAAVGTALGPVGTAVGGLVGGVVGGIAGSTFGAALYEGGKKVVTTAVRVVKAIGSTVVSGLKAAGSFVKRGIASIFGW